MYRLILLSTLIIFPATSCAPQPDVLKMLPRSWSTYKMTQKTKVEITKSTISGIEPNDLIFRQNYLKEMNNSYTLVLSEATSMFKEMRAEARGNSEKSLIVSAVGILSGITSTTLIVASPANGVLAAAFGGIGTGALGYQTRLVQEGFTRDAVARAFKETSESFGKAHSAFRQAKAELVFTLTSIDEKPWAKAAVEAEKSLCEMINIIIVRYIPTSIESDLKKLEDKVTKIDSQMNKPQKENNQPK